MFDSISQSVGSLLASDAALMMLSMSFGILVGMLWSGRSLPRRIPPAQIRSVELSRRS